MKIKEMKHIACCIVVIVLAKSVLPGCIDEQQPPVKT